MVKVRIMRDFVTEWRGGLHWIQLKKGQEVEMSKTLVNTEFMIVIEPPFEPEKMARESL